MECAPLLVLNTEEKERVLLLAFPLSHKCSMTFVGLISSTAKIPGLLKATGGTLALRTGQGSFLEHRLQERRLFCMHLHLAFLLDL